MPLTTTPRSEPSAKARDTFPLSGPCQNVSDKGGFMSFHLIETERLHEGYENSPQEVRKAIDESYREVSRVFGMHGFSAFGDDRAEELVAAIYYFYQRCNKELISG